MAAVAINVPVNGANGSKPDGNDGCDTPKLVVPEELMTVFNRLSPFPPCRLNRFNTLLFGAFRLTIISIVRGIVILMVTRMSIMTAPAGRLTPERVEVE